MNNYVQTKICEIKDAKFQSLVADLRHCVGWDAEEFDELDNQSLYFLLMSIGREERAITKQHLAVNGILTTKVDKLSPDSVVYDVCRELVHLNKTHIESFDGKTVLTLIKRCYKVFSPPSRRLKKPTRKENRRLFATELIKSRRRNGDL